MTSIRSLGATVVLVALLAAGCGGSAASSSPVDAGSGAGASADTGNGATATPAPAGNANVAAGDAATVAKQLVPPNSTEQSKTTTDTYWYVIYGSTDTPASLKGFYESQIPKTGLKIVSTTSSNGTYAWAISKDEAGSFGGSVTVGPASDGSAGSVVVVAIGS
jgi:hypothetical protein